MLAQIRNAVVVVHAPVISHCVDRADAVLGYHKRQPIAAVRVAEQVAQTCGIDSPAPAGLLKIRVLEPAEERTALTLRRDACLDHFARVVVHTDPVETVGCERLRIFRTVVERNALALILAQLVCGERPRAHGVYLVEITVHALERREHIGRAAGFGIHRRDAEHATHLRRRVNLVDEMHGAHARHRHVIAERR